MAISCSGAEGIFSHMQEDLRHVEGKSVALTRGVHKVLVDFRWLVEDQLH